MTYSLTGAFFLAPKYFVPMDRKESPKHGGPAAFNWRTLDDGSILPAFTSLELFLKFVQTYYAGEGSTEPRHFDLKVNESAEGPDALSRAECIMRRIAEGLGGDPVHDRSRILRVPATYNSKYGEPRPVVIERFDPDLRYGLEDLEEMAKALPRIVGDDAHDGGTVSRDVLRGPIKEGERNVALASTAGSLRNRGLDAETICVVLLEVNRRRCEPPLDEAEVVGIGQSIGRYPAGRPRYVRSSAKRIYPNDKR